MKRDYFEKLEQVPVNTSLNINAVLDQLAFNEKGLIPVITQDAKSNDVLMLAWMNREALELTSNSVLSRFFMFFILIPSGDC